MSSGSVCIVIVNYRTAALAIDCLQSLAVELAGLPGSRVLVVDNDSADGSLERLGQAIADNGWSDWAQAVASGRNGGFAYGNNVGIRLATAGDVDTEHLLLLNPDTVVRRGAVRALLDFMDSHPGAGIVGSRLEDAVGVAECSAHTAPSPLGELESSARLGLFSRLFARHRVSPPLRDHAHVCDWVSGASMLIRRRVVDAVGGLDEGFFLYFEEVDFCTRARHAGWQVWFEPASHVVHLEGAATGIQAVAKRRPRFWYDSRRRYFVKHHGIVGLLAADLLWLAGRMTYLARRTVGLAAAGGGNDPLRFTRDMIGGDLASLLRGELAAIPREGRAT